MYRLSIPKLLAVDLDGTLISDYGEFERPVSQANLAALRKLREAGTEIVICTGRSESSARSILERCGDAELVAGDLILQNGALVLEGGTGRVLGIRPLAKADARAYLAVYREHDLAPMLFLHHDLGGACLYEGPVTNPRQALYLEIRAKEDGGTLRRVDDLADHLERDPLSMASIDYGEPILAARRAMEALALSGSRIAVQGLVGWAGGEPAQFLEVFRSGVGKELAFGEYCAARGIDPRDCAAIGDGGNDLELIRLCGVGIAMGNAPSKVKEAADHVAPPYNENGLATAILDCFLS